MASEIQNPSNPNTEKATATSKSSDRSMDYAVFINTSLGHRFVMQVSDSDTVRDLKYGKIMLEYPICFPEVGEIKVRSIEMVGSKGHLYRLAESMLVRKAFEETIGVIGPRRSLFVVASSHYYPPDC